MMNGNVVNVPNSFDVQTESKVPSIKLDIVNGDELKKPRLTRLISPGGSGFRKLLRSEGCKTFLCALYVYVHLSMVEFAVAIVQFRIPDREKYPPLPDIILDNITRMPFADKVNEVMVVLSLLSWAFVMFLHKRRLVLLRRFGCLMVIVYVPRAWTILMTSLPVPSKEKFCIRREGGSLETYFQLAYRISTSQGLRLNGLQTCGDYMYSGHTVAVTLFTCLIREYTPRRWIFIYVITWAANVTGMFCILASHGHYSVDIYIAFVLTFGAFNFYHALANNRESLASDKNRTFPFFLLFYYFEPDRNFRVKNEFEWPLTREKINSVKDDVKELFTHICR